LQFAYLSFAYSREAHHLAWNNPFIKILSMWRYKIIIALCAVGSLFILATEDPAVKKFGDMIVAEDMKEYLSILASDAMEGRETGKRGQKMAAAFIRAHFEDLGLTAPDCRQLLPANGVLYDPTRRNFSCAWERSLYES
jgi:hypothetical protein